MAAVAIVIGAAGALRAAPSPAAAVTGQVRSAERPMAGVLVNVQRFGSNIMTTVVTDTQGRYHFPTANVAPGTYSVSIRAEGWDLVGPASVVVRPGSATTADLKLAPTINFEDQVSNAEWLSSAPGTLEQKNMLLNCVDCHTVQRIFDSYHTAAEWKNFVLPRMTGMYANNSFWLRPQAFPAGTKRGSGFPADLPDYLASINQSTGPRKWPLKTFPRLTGVSAKVIVTTYMLPSKLIQPHDVIQTADGAVWFDDFGGQNLGKLDAKTGAITMYRVPANKPNYIMGDLELDRGANGDLWLAGMFQGQIVAFDPKTATFKQYPVPPATDPNQTQESMVMPLGDGVNGIVWTNNQNVHAFEALDVKAGTWTTYGPYKTPNSDKAFSAYGLLTDAKNTVWGLDFGGADIGHLVPGADPALTIYQTPSEHSRPRRGRVDPSTGILWFAEYGANGIGEMDTNNPSGGLGTSNPTGGIKEFPMPVPFEAPYDVVADKNGDVWAGSMLTDRVVRLDPKTGRSVQYQLPADTNIRRVWVDNAKNPVELWIGNNHQGSIIRVQPLD